MSRKKNPFFSLAAFEEDIKTECCPRHHPFARMLTFCNICVITIAITVSSYLVSCLLSKGTYTTGAGNKRSGCDTDMPFLAHPMLKLNYCDRSIVCLSVRSQLQKK